MAKKCGEKRKNRTKTLRVVKKGHLDKEKELEPKESYIASGHEKDTILLSSIK